MEEGGEWDWGVGIWGGVAFCERTKRRALMGVFDVMECPDGRNIYVCHICSRWYSIVPIYTYPDKQITFRL